MSSPAMPEVSAAALVGAVIDAIGTEGFCPALTAWLQTVAPYSFTVVFGYRGEAKPIDLYDDFPSHRRKVFVTDYLEGPYLLDPFCQGAIRPVEPGFHRLRSLAPDRFYQGEYFRSYYMRTEIAEEIGCFAEMPGDCHVVFSLMREEKPFSAPEFRKLTGVAPIVTALMRRHWADLSREFATRSTPRPALTGDGLDRLTPREREITGWILKGYSAEATGQELGIASGTVRIHRRNIYAKLGISSQRELFARFLAGISP
ncbi:helix-turn-helix transcriptional regulator [Rhodobacter sphaeroides]|uniref:DMSO reductase regulatory protein DorX n=2 Tax=Cereibacter sphaeroides TaxID=1063 RepID=Q3IXS7_CERS4|nr:helix-turn-helix transcriptional regulator [Cereibacter sphaeroides]ABN78850.1 transcriptional regulator, LuxR family [Cereibacter sphaeroides ATCC 17029]AAC34671.1 DMSO reductase regulatory protein DorX [Cereibacter sphaeroides]ABA80657.1 DMSO reductase regulatory protein DorX [Cereibacter sphaeroides 2.4.1]AMJ48986.1 LuxR family transcriptional regulator [Cereibacter sphaeroides]ANS35702.1 helix-turn-helix transcriptional regulator [Cereibacter sphaeroides]